MRPIPTEIWIKAIAAGRLYRAYDETKNIVVRMTLFTLLRQIDDFLKTTRKERR